MIRGPEGDTFRGEWLLVALPALLGHRVPPDRSSTVGITVDGELIQVHATPAGIEVSRHDGRELDAVVTADAAIVLGLATGALALDDVGGIVDIDGDEAAVRAIFSAPRDAA